MLNVVLGSKGIFVVDFVATVDGNVGFVGLVVELIGDCWCWCWCWCCFKFGKRFLISWKKSEGKLINEGMLLLLVLAREFD